MENPTLLSTLMEFSGKMLCVCLVTQSRLTLVTPRTVACQAPLSMEFSRHEYWSGLPFPSPGALPGPGTEVGYLASPALAI